MCWEVCEIPHFQRLMTDSFYSLSEIDLISYSTQRVAAVLQTIPGKSLSTAACVLC